LSEPYSYVFSGYGTDYQLSYLFPSNYEIIGRFSSQKVKDDLHRQINLPHTMEYTLGITKYLWEHTFKLQAEITYDKLNFYEGNSKNNLYFRFQFEIGI
jgi:hypothetical protein